METNRQAINLGVSGFEYHKEWLAREAARLSAKEGRPVRPSQVVQRLIEKAMREEEE